MNGDYFDEKDEAIRMLEESDDESLQIFAQDTVENKGYKCYYLYNYKTIYNNIIKSKKSHYYEYILKNKQVKLMFDIDCKPVQESFKKTFDEIINRILDVFKESISQHTNIKPEIIILQANTENKKSSHIIFNNIFFNDTNEMKIYVKEIIDKNKLNNILFKENLVDESIYREGCFRLLHCSKKGKTNRFSFYRSENYQYKNDYKLFLDTLIQNCDKNIDYFIMNIPNKNNEKKVLITKIKIDKTDINNIDIKNNVVKLCYLLNKNRFDEYEKWFKIGCLMKNLDISFNIFNELSSQSEKYTNYEDTLNKWNKFPTKEQYNIGYLYYYAKEDSPKEYENLFSNYYDKEDLKLDIDLININQRRLLDLSKNSLLTDDTDVLTKSVKQWYNDSKYKILTIKSPYDTGKTTLIQSILNVYNPKRVLFISYRRTLTYDIYGLFEERYNFSSYMDKKYLEDRLIIQVESIGNLINSYNIGFDEEIKIPGYDLVIIDECESVLNQFNSTTFKKLNPREVFEFMDSIITNSKKALFLDGDMDLRSYDFVKSYTENKSLHIVNTIKINEKILNLTKIRSYFVNELFLDISNGLNIGIVSMSASEAEDLYLVIKKKFPDKKILLYTGDTSDKDKENLKNVLKAWSDVNVLIYSPTIEAGVSYDREHFDKLYGIISDFSTSQRAYKQMLNRIRKIKCNNVLIYNKSFNFHNISLWKFNEVKRSLISLDTIKLNKQKSIDSNGHVSYKLCLDKFDINYIHNKVEELNKNQHFFLVHLKELCLASGYDFNLIDDTINFDIMNDPLLDEKVDTSKYVNICMAKDITHEEYSELLKKQINSNATQDEKYIIKKYLYLNLFGVKKLNNQILSNLNKTNIENFLNLIDKKSLTHYIDSKKEYNTPVDLSNNNLANDHTKYLSEKLGIEANKLNEKLSKLDFINSIINGLGLKHIFDQKYLDPDVFEESVKYIIDTNKYFQNFKDLKVLFNLSKIKKKDDLKDTKSFIRFINPILENYNISIRHFQKKLNNENKRCYFISRINNIDEIINYKIVHKKFRLIDSNQIFNFTNKLIYDDIRGKLCNKIFNYELLYNDLIL